MAETTSPGRRAGRRATGGGRGARAGEASRSSPAASSRPAARDTAARDTAAKDTARKGSGRDGGPGATRGAKRDQKPDQKRDPRRGPFRRWLRRILLAAVLLALLPFGLVALYAVPGVHPVSTLMLADTLSGRAYTREWRPLDDFPPALVASVLASEDGRFCAHGGVDWGAVATVAREAMGGERPRGASTVTMQTVKNLFLPPSRSVLRKAAEVPLALAANLLWGKRRTLEIYLNVAEWAPGHYGAAAGARAWFGRDVASLTPGQAARMAVTLPNPHIRNPADPGPRMAALARLNAERAAGMGPYLGCLDD